MIGLPGVGCMADDMKEGIGRQIREGAAAIGLRRFILEPARCLRPDRSTLDRTSPPCFACPGPEVALYVLPLPEPGSRLCSRLARSGTRRGHRRNRQRFAWPWHGASGAPPY